MNTTPLPSTPRSDHHDTNHPETRPKMAGNAVGADSSSSSSSSASSASTLLICPICCKQLKNPHILPCLHVFCLGCLRDECQGKSVDKYFCPLCVVDDLEEGPKSHQARTWHSFERIQEQESVSEELQRRLDELPGTEISAASGSNEDSWGKDDTYDSSSEGGDSDSNRKSSILEPPVLFPCTMHHDRLADTFCLKCDQLACHKCVSSFHRRCQNFSGLHEAVDVKRRQFDSIHDKMAANLVACEDVVESQRLRLQEIEDMRTHVLSQIKKFRTEMVNAVLAKEKLLTNEANLYLDALKDEANGKNVAASKLANSLQKQMELLDLSFSVQGEAELLPFLPGLNSRINKDAKLIISKQHGGALSQVSFIPDLNCKSVVDASSLGEIHIEGAQNGESGAGSQRKNDVTESLPDLDLALVTSFHGGTREDTTEPLLTDLIMVANGDIILTDRDNKCVKKFNQTGKLLTRVLLDAVPSRITTVSHARAVVSVMNKKALYFLSLFGTVRILHTVKVKKLYSFLTSLGDGLLAAGTNLCESIDILSEHGETIRSILTQKPEKASISRPLYLTPVVPHWSVIPHTKEDKDVASDKKKNEENSVPDKCTDVNSRRASVNDNSNSSSNSSNGSNINSHATSSKGSSTHSTSSKKSSKKPSKKTVTTPTTDSSTASSSSSSTSSSSSSSTLPLSDQDILVSDSGKRVMFRLHREGSVAFTLRSSDQLNLECPLGVTVHEKGLTLLVDRDSDCVMLLDKHGQFLKNVLGQREGLAKPCGIYAGLKGSVALSQVDGTVKVYKTVT